MEENNNNIHNSQLQDVHNHHCWKRCFVTAVAAFLGSFLAFYFVADQMMYKYHNHNNFNHKKFEKKVFNDIDKMYKNDMKAIDEAFDRIHDNFMSKKHNNILKTPVFMMDSVKIKTEFDDGKYNIIIGLKPFQEDINRINYNINGRKLTVFGNSEIMDKNYVQDISFSQDFILPENADTSKISKIKEGNKLIISIPLKN